MADCGAFMLHGASLSVNLQVTREEARRQPGSYLRGPATYESGYCVHLLILANCNRTHVWPLSHLTVLLGSLAIATSGLALIFQTTVPSHDKRRSVDQSQAHAVIADPCKAELDFTGPQQGGGGTRQPRSLRKPGCMCSPMRLCS